MTAILVTGMSGVGKSAAVDELARRGFGTIDTGNSDWIRFVHGEPIWDEDRICLRRYALTPSVRIAPERRPHHIEPLSGHLPSEHRHRFCDGRLD